MSVARDAGVKLSADGPSLVVEADDPPSPQLPDVLRAHKSEILVLLCDKRRAVVTWIDDNFKPGPTGRCVHCDGGSRQHDPFVALSIAEDRADIHASCHPEWMAEQEAEARIALGIEALTEREAINE